jgi:predicted outer membrane lipoprotein
VQGLSEASIAFPADTAMWEEEMEKSKQMKEEI